MSAALTIRLTTEADLPALRTLMTLSIDRGQAAVLTPEQVVASRAVMGLDTQLVRDGTYFVVEEASVPVGCGGWSRRATLYGGDHSTALRDPGCSIRRRTPPAFAPCIPTRIMSDAGSGG